MYIIMKTNTTSTEAISTHGDPSSAVFPTREGNGCPFPHQSGLDTPGESSMREYVLQNII